MNQTLAFDVYGTLIDTAGIARELQGIAGERAALFSSHWRAKQLEYSFRRGLMGRYEAFSVCTRDALRFTSEALAIGLPADEEERLMDAYRQLPAFPEVPESLSDLASAGHRLYAFSNGPPGDLDALLGHAGLDHCFEDIVSVDEIRSFKPDPRVYRHFLKRAGATAGDSWLISGNPFDLLGAANCDFHTAWVKRDPAALFDPWGTTPDITLRHLGELRAGLEKS